MKEKIFIMTSIISSANSHVSPARRLQ